MVSFHQCSLHLFETSLSEIDGTAPGVIDLVKYMDGSDQKSLVVGRGSPAFPTDVIVNARTSGKEIISRNHIKLTYTSENGWEVEDLKSLNGTFVNRKRVSTAPLRNGDVLQLGGISNLPVGGLISESDLCIKYRFLYQESSATTKAKNKRAPSTPTVEQNSAKKKSKILKQSNADMDLDAAHAALNRIHAGKDAQITELSIALQIAEKKYDQALAHQQSKESKISDLELQIAESDKMIVSLQKRYTQLQARCATAEEGNMELRDKCADLTKRHDELLQQSRVKEDPQPAFQADDSCAVTTSALNMVLSCALCNKLLIDPVAMHCSHGYCRVCLEQARHANPNFACTVCAAASTTDYVKIAILKEIMMLLNEAATPAERKAYTERKLQHQAALNIK